MLDAGAVGHRQHGFRDILCERAQAGSLAADQHHSFHAYLLTLGGFAERIVA